jgi:hypothetical protein
MILNVYVPVEGSRAASSILKGSAVVSDGVEREGRIHAWYEGNAYGAENLEDLYGRTVVAAGRLKTDYPTVAKAFYHTEELREVATFDAERNVFVEIADPDALRDWCGESLEQIAGARLDPGRHERIGVTDFLNQLNMLGSDGGQFYYRSRAGQIVTASGGGVFQVHDHDDPEIRERLSAVLDPARLTWAVGTEQTADFAPR